MPSQKLTICFDLDGTLINSAPDLFNALDHCLISHSFPLSDHNKISPHIGQGAKAMIRKALEDSQLSAITSDEDLIEKLWHSFIDHYKIHSADHSHPFDGAVVAMELLSDEGHTLAVCTNKTEQLTLPLLDKLDLSKHFSAITCADSYPFKKPDPRHLLNTITKAGGTPPHALMIGDSRTDIETAKNADIPSIGVDWGYTDIPMHELSPDHLISHFNELPELIRKISG